MTEPIPVKLAIVSPLFQPSYMPAYATSGAAGLDLHACIPQPVLFEPGARIRIPTGIAIELPRQDVVALVYARSGWAAKYGVGLTNGVGVIDSDYRGEIEVLLSHHGDEALRIEPGDRIAQMVIAPLYVANWTVVERLDDTDRGAGGFGSTGR
jgi:dUTP pyrophosphatase